MITQTFRIATLVAILIGSATTSFAAAPDMPNAPARPVAQQGVQLAQGALPESFVRERRYQERHIGKRYYRDRDRHYDRRHYDRRDWSDRHRPRHHYDRRPVIRIVPG